MKEKAKYSTPRMSNLKFLLLWMGGHVGVWSLGVLVAMTLPRLNINFFGPYLAIMLGALGTGVLSAILQTLLVERALGQSMRRWIPVSSLGWFLSGLAMNFTVHLLVTSPVEPPEFMQRMILIPLFLPVALLQWAWLRGRVKNAWLWVVAAMVSAILFAMPLISPPNLSGMRLSPEIQSLLPYLAIGLSALLYSGATGATMRYLWSQPRDKSKNDAARANETEDEDSARLDRLAEPTAGYHPALPASAPATEASRITR